MAPSLTTFHLTLVYVRDVFSPQHSSTLAWTMYWGGCRRSRAGSVFGTVRITDLHIVDDAVIFAETTEVLAGALDSLSEEAEPLGLRVSWIKNKVQAFGDILDATLESIPLMSENVEFTQTFTYVYVCVCFCLSVCLCHVICANPIDLHTYN